MSKTREIIREHKAFPFKVKEFDDEQGIVRGYLSTFDNIDDGGDRVLPNAFKRTLANKYEYKQKHEMKYLFPLLWQHSTDQPIGGYTEAREDATGLFVELQIDLDVQQGREAYSALKKGYIFNQSMGYDVLQSSWVKVEDKNVRDLIEVRLWEGSIVTFPMNTLAIVTDVKSIDTKTVCGNTSGPIGPRDEVWDGAKAKKQIWAVCEKDDGSINTTLAKKYFMSVNGDVQQKGSYSYPFWYADTSPHICVGGVKAVANALQGARGADSSSDSGGMKKKVETLYNRINAKYGDDTPLEPPWKDKGSTMDRQRKTFEEHFAEESCEDLLEDWQDVLVCALSCAVLDAFKIGDQPKPDVQSALTAFNDAVMKWVDQAIEYSLSDYLEENSYSRSDADNLIQYGSESKPNYGSYYGMASSRRIARKAGRAISKTTSEKIQSHIDTLHDMAKSHKSAIMNAADDLATILQGSEPAYGTDPGTPDKPEGKTASHDDARGAQPHSSEQDTVNEQELTAMLDSLRALRIS